MQAGRRVNLTVDPLCDPERPWRKQNQGKDLGLEDPCFKLQSQSSIYFLMSQQRVMGHRIGVREPW